MKKWLTIVPSDQLVLVDGIAYQFPFIAPVGVHALQWDAVAGKGAVEYLDGRENEGVTDLAAFSSVMVALESHLAGVPPSSLHERNEQGEWEVSLAKAKVQKAQDINAARAAALDSGVLHAGHQWDSDESSRANIIGTVAACTAGIALPQGFTWRTADNQDVPMGAEDLVGLGAAMLQHVNTCYQQSWRLKAAVDAASTVAELEAIT